MQHKLCVLSITLPKSAPFSLNKGSEEVPINGSLLNWGKNPTCCGFQKNALFAVIISFMAATYVLNYIAENYP